MLEEEKSKKPPEDPEDWDMNNLHDFFKLLLEVDKRTNPQSYKAHND